MREVRVQSANAERQTGQLYRGAVGLGVLADAWAPARRPEKTQSEIDNPLTYEFVQMPIAVRPAAYRPGTGLPAAVVAAPVSSSTITPPRVIIGQG
jgi:hypothetical protein